MSHPDLPAPRRGAGVLEAAVLAVLWDAGRALSAGEVQAALAERSGAGAPQLSYSTVVTILSRLHAKNALARRREGRAYRYVPVADEAGLAARRLAAMLDTQPDREAVLSRFVADLSEDDERLLRGLLGGSAGAG
jgi:predicted transcriptional regulator